MLGTRDTEKLSEAKLIKKTRRATTSITRYSSINHRNSPGKQDEMSPPLISFFSFSVSLCLSLKMCPLAVFCCVYRVALLTRPVDFMCIHYLHCLCVLNETISPCKEATVQIESVTCCYGRLQRERKREREVREKKIHVKCVHGKIRVHTSRGLRFARCVKVVYYTGTRFDQSEWEREERGERKCFIISPVNPCPK